ncbi:MAG TPA: hypothetical protein PKD96_00385 [Candidatus Absconditabacterales bacterium]|nr:hypothetical protein [Candidatus Absconditabacterales bacterium]HMT26737.1 hypothetical protein [Candidatus Absconditabacterales bacterium]
MKLKGLGLLAILGYIVIGLLTLYFIFKVFSGNAFLPFDWIILIIGLIIAGLLVFFVEGITILNLLGTIFGTIIGAFVLLYLLSLAGIDISGMLRNGAKTTTNTTKTVVDAGKDTADVVNDTDTTGAVVATDQPMTNEPIVIEYPTQTTVTEINPSVNQKFFKQSAKNEITLSDNSVGGNMSDDGTVQQTAENVIIYNGQKARQATENVVVLQNGKVVYQKSVETPSSYTQPVQNLSNTASVGYTSPELDFIVDDKFAPEQYQTPNGKRFEIFNTDKGFMFKREDNTLGSVVFQDSNSLKNYLKANNL